MSFTVNDRGHVCLTFDFDGPSVWLMRRMDTPTPVSRGEFGAVAVPRILKLLEKRDIGSTWFIPGHTIETYPDVCKMVADHGCEVGLHGYTHELNPFLSEEDERALFVRTIELVEKLTGAVPTGYRSPAGEMTNQTIDLLVEYGMTYDSSLMGHDYQPYALRSGDEYPMDGPMKFGGETPLVELPWSWTLDDYVYLEFVTFKRMLMPGLKRPEDMFANFTGDVEWMARDVQAGVVTPIFHPQVIGRGHRLLAMENWIDQIADLGITFSKLTDIAAAHHAGTSFGIE
jgi:peptidoglycan/xylan/chitin deacetylase (PgdA/CDA1 family)